MNELIAIVDDEPDIIELVSLHLEKAGFQVEGIPDAKTLFEFLNRKIPDLLILDLMLPGTDGFEICKHLKRDDAFLSLPIIMLTARAEELDKVLGLELGADDYVTKPFSPKELVARVKAVLRRGERGEKTDRIKIGGLLEIDCRKYTVTVEGEVVELTPTEFRIVKMFALKPGWVFSRNQILEHLWGREKIVVERTVDVHIKNLRQKLGKTARFIRNVRGIGYKLEE